MPEATRRALAVIVVVYAGTAALAWLARDSWLAWVLSLPLIAALQNHLFLLHHEGAHGLLHPRRAWNDLLANLFCGYPFLESLPAYRRFHFAHHRHVADGARDPEIAFYAAQGYHFAPQSRGRRLWLAALDLSGYHWAQFFWAFMADSLRGQGARFFIKRDYPAAVIFLVICSGLVIAGAGSMIFWSWIVPQVTVAFFLAKQRSLREHGARTGTLEGCTFNESPRMWERFFLFPLHSHLHLTHHRSPGLEWYRLPRA